MKLCTSTRVKFSIFMNLNENLKLKRKKFFQKARGEKASFLCIIHEMKSFFPYKTKLRADFQIFHSQSQCNSVIRMNWSILHLNMIVLKCVAFKIQCSKHFPTLFVLSLDRQDPSTAFKRKTLRSLKHDVTFHPCLNTCRIFYAESWSHIYYILLNK